MLLILSPNVRAIFETDVDIFFRVPPFLIKNSASFHSTWHYFFILQPQPILVVRRHRPRDQDLGLGEQEHGWGAEARGSLYRKPTPCPAPVSLHGLVSRRSDPLRRLLRQQDQGVAGRHCRLKIISPRLHAGPRKFTPKIANFQDFFIGLVFAWNSTKPVGNKRHRKFKLMFCPSFHLIRRIPC